MLQIDMSANDTYGNGIQLNPDAPIFKAAKSEAQILAKIIANQNEDIFSLKLINFEEQIEINKKDEEIQRFMEIIENYSL